MTEVWGDASYNILYNPPTTLSNPPTTDISYTIYRLYHSRKYKSKDNIISLLHKFINSNNIIHY